MSDFETMIGIREKVRGAENALATMSREDLAVSQGKAFSLADSATVGGGAAKRWILTTPNSAIRCHARIWIEANADGLAELYENPTITVAGTALAELNMDRNSATAATLAVAEDPTVTVDGTLLCAVTLGTAGEAALQRSARRILKANEDYMIRWTDAAGGSTATVYVEWMEL